MLSAVMTVEEALEFVENLLQSQQKRPLSDLQRALFRGSWQGQTYEKMYVTESLAERCSIDHLKRNVGPELWQILTELLAEPVSKKGLQGCVERARHRCFAARPPVATVGPEMPSLPIPPPDPCPPESWSNAPDTSNFHGREQDLEKVRHWITLDGCRLVLLYGIRGVGKTLFATRLAREVQPQFDFVVWRSLSDWHASKRSPTTKQLLADLLGLWLDLPASQCTLEKLLRHLQQTRCLLVLDGVEAVLASPGMSQAFSEILETLSTRPHQSCVLLTSQEEPQEINRMKGDQKLVRALQLRGLGELAARNLLLTQGTLVGSEGEWQSLIRAYTGHPRVLNGIASLILTLTGGQIAHFLSQWDPMATLEIYTLLQPDMKRLTGAEWAICQYLYQRGEPILAADLLRDLSQSPQRQALPLQELTRALDRLNRKSLAFAEEGYYQLHPLVFRYLTQHYATS